MVLPRRARSTRLIFISGRGRSALASLAQRFRGSRNIVADGVDIGIGGLQPASTRSELKLVADLGAGLARDPLRERPDAALISDLPANDLDEPLRRRLRRHEAEILPPAPDEIGHASVVDRVVLAAPALFLRIIGLIGERDLADVFRRAGETDQPRVEGRDIFGKTLDRVALRIESDEDRLNGF
ncbi:MAG: hypothetical protein QOC72_1389, partial [Methylobacteriaceae bacterium]|nr:hypothetical protein [Methylobacteriaceae bacterium]